MLSREERLLNLSTRIQTPFVVYNSEIIKAKVKELHCAFSNFAEVKVLYSAKAHSSLGVLAFLRQLKVGVDVSSYQEYEIAKISGYEDSNISLTSYGLSQKEIEAIASTNIYFNADSISQLDHICKHSEQRRKLGIRINPGVGYDAKGLCIGGGPESKFGIDPSVISEAVAMANATGHELVGAHFHLGSEIYEADLHINAINSILDHWPSDHLPRYINVGGGYAWAKQPWTIIFRFTDLASKLKVVLSEKYQHLDYFPQLFIEPGESLISQSANLICSVLSIKKVFNSKGGIPKYRLFACLDTNIHHFPNVFRYHGDHVSLLNTKTIDRETQKKIYQLAGNTNQSQDILVYDCELPVLHPNDVIKIDNVGGYSFAYSNNFNGRNRPAEVLKLENYFHLVRRHEVVEDQLTTQTIPLSLKI